MRKSWLFIISTFSLKQIFIEIDGCLSSLQEERKIYTKIDIIFIRKGKREKAIQKISQFILFEIYWIQYEKYQYMNTY